MVDSIFGKEESVSNGHIRDPPPAAITKRAANSNGDIKKPNGYSNGHANGYANGHANGYANGHVNGYANGHANGYANDHANGAMKVANGTANPKKETHSGQLSLFPAI